MLIKVTHCQIGSCIICLCSYQTQVIRNSLLIANFKFGQLQVFRNLLWHLIVKIYMEWYKG